RTTYRFDVRSADEYARGHRPGFRHAPGGQLVQETDHQAPVRGARIVLTDDDSVRANMAASWLAQMGWEVAVLAPDAAAQTEAGADRVPQPATPEVATVSAAELAAWQSQGDDSVVVVDLTSSANHVARHIPGAWWTTRARLASALRSTIPTRAKRVVLTCGSSLLARFGAADVAELVASQGRELRVLAGGNAAWFAAGLPQEQGEQRLAAPRDDRYRRPYEGTDNPASAMQAYLDWEFGLIAQLDRDGTHFFKVLAE
ncbi:MAG: rhodanese-like domain-containing protein, partial [Rhizobacter sp.]